MKPELSVPETPIAKNIETHLEHLYAYGVESQDANLALKALQLLHKVKKKTQHIHLEDLSDENLMTLMAELEACNGLE
jgi:hypothetical protein